MAAKAKAAPATTWTTHDVARIFAISLSTVQALITERVINREEKGGFDQAKTAQAIVRDREEKLRRRYATDAAAKASLADTKARLALLELKRAEGEVIDTAIATRVVGELFGRSKVRLLAVPSRVIPRLASTRNAVEAKALLEEEIELALIDLSQSPNLAREAVDAALGGDKE